MGDLLNVLTVKLRIHGPQPKSMLRTKRHCRKHLVAPCVPDLRLEKIELNPHVSASQVLRELGRQEEATGEGPAWPLANVDVE
ncbi:hypothetical protein [Mesorhizobium sp. WSM3224]|uniref:hypothetical protein n=1 Tax=Mesorhizobium sp. WSM3224 TaxID=1040986 RepID=UPI0003FE9F3D|nr:hypothetical protein [Mesorhizobium sp. WSM3224]